MSQVSRPVQIALIAVALFAMAWFVALKPKPSSQGGGSTPAASQDAPDAPGVAGLKRAVDKAHGAAATAQADVTRAGATSTDAPAQPAKAPAGAAKPVAATHAKAHPYRPVGVRSHHRAAHVDRHVAFVRKAIQRHRAVAIAFVNPTSADSVAVRDELRHVSHFGGRAVVLSVPIADLSKYGFITRDVQITTAPTTVVITPKGHASTIVGFTDRVEVEQRLADALAKR